MKKGIFLLSLLCMLVCSCTKSEPEPSLIGSWDVSGTLTYDTENDYKYEVNGWTITFKEDGIGEVTSDSVLGNYTFEYVKENNTVRYTAYGSEIILNIDSLTQDSFVFHYTGAISFGGYTESVEMLLNGKRK